MNILQVLPELNVGGVETGTLDSTKYLVRYGHKVVVVSNGGELVKELESYGAIHYQLPVHKKSLITAFKMVPRLVEIIKKEEIVIVHARSRVPAWIAYFSSRITNTVFITTCHGYYQKHAFSQVMGWAKRVISISNAVARHMIDDFGVPHERIRLIPCSVDLERFQVESRLKKKEGDFNIGIIGRISPIKGHNYFIKAMAKVAQVLPNIKIWIVGDAPPSKEAYKEQLQVLVKRLGLAEITEFLGVQRDIPAILSQLDLLVLATTVPEAFGRVIVEAQACMVPVVSTRVGGVVDIIEDDYNGLLVPPADPKGMADAIIRVLKDKELARRLTENAYKKVKEKFSADLMVKDTLEVYKEALANYKLLIIKLGSLGDVILSTAGIKAISKKFSSSHKISLLIGEESKGLLLRCPYIDELLVCDFKARDKGLKGFLRIARILRKRDFDLVIDLQNNRLSHLLSFFSLSPKRYGYDNKKLGFLLNQRIVDDKASISPVAHQFRILKLLGINLDSEKLQLWPSDEDKRYIDEFLNSQWLSDSQRLIGINISASPRWQSKNWAFKNLVKLCEELGRRDMRVVITGLEKDLTKAKDLMERAKGVNIINACAKTSVNQLFCLIKKCSVFVTGDSAPLHIAAATGVPFVALFGPTEPSRHLPAAQDCVVIKKGLACSPCYKAKCRHGECMELITPDEVLEAIDKLLK